MLRCISTPAQARRNTSRLTSRHRDQDVHATVIVVHSTCTFSVDVCNFRTYASFGASHRVYIGRVVERILHQKCLGCGYLLSPGRGRDEGGLQTCANSRSNMRVPPRGLTAPVACFTIIAFRSSAHEVFHWSFFRLICGGRVGDFSTFRASFSRIGYSPL